MTKAKWLDIAEVLNAFRIIPRLILTAFALLTAVVSYELIQWFTSLPTEERTLEASGFVTLTIAAVSKFSLDYAGVYTQK